MIIYEVNLQISTEILATYVNWLHPHIQKMLKFPGFVTVFCLKEHKNDPQYTYLSLQYHISTQAHLDDYLQHHAQKMREEAQAFQGQFSASRRIFTLDTPDQLAALLFEN